MYEHLDIDGIRAELNRLTEVVHETHREQTRLTREWHRRNAEAAQPGDWFAEGYGLKHAYAGPAAEPDKITTACKRTIIAAGAATINRECILCAKALARAVA